MSASMTSYFPTAASSPPKNESNRSSSPPKNTSNRTSSPPMGASMTSYFPPVVLMTSRLDCVIDLVLLKHGSLFGSRSHHAMMLLRLQVPLTPKLLNGKKNMRMLRESSIIYARTWHRREMLNVVHAGELNLVHAGVLNLVHAGQLNVVHAGQLNVVYAGERNLVHAGQLNVVQAGPPNLVHAGQFSVVHAGLHAQPSHVLNPGNCMAI